MLYTTILRPTLIYGSECWSFSKTDENFHRKFERIILRLIYGPVKDNGIWRTRSNSQNYTLYDKPDVVKVVMLGRLRWLGHLFRIQELDPCRKLTLLKPEGTRFVGKPKLR
jgi:hypothetical protein